MLNSHSWHNANQNRYIIKRAVYNDIFVSTNIVWRYRLRCIIILRHQQLVLQYKYTFISCYDSVQQQRAFHLMYTTYRYMYNDIGWHYEYQNMASTVLISIVLLCSVVILSRYCSYTTVNLFTFTNETMHMLLFVLVILLESHYFAAKVRVNSKRYCGFWWAIPIQYVSKHNVLQENNSLQLRHQ